MSAHAWNPKGSPRPSLTTFNYVKLHLTMASSMSRQFYLHTSLAAVSRTRSRAANNHARWSCDSTRPCPTCCHVPALVWRRIARQEAGDPAPKVCLDERHTPPNLGCWSYDRDSQLLYALCKKLHNLTKLLS